MKKLIHLSLGAALFIFLFASNGYTDSMEFKDEFVIITLQDEVKFKKKEEAKALKDMEDRLSRESVQKVLDKIIRDVSKGELKINHSEISNTILENYIHYVKDIKVLKLEKEKRFLRRGILRKKFEIIVYKDKIRKELLQESFVLGDLLKYDIYVELYWAAKDHDLDPEVIDISKENVKKILINQGFSLVDFSAVRDRILKLKMADREDLSEVDVEQLDEFEKNLAITQVSRYERGLAILADYAQVLVGVTIRNIEVINDMTNIDLALEAYLIEGGKRREIAKVDEHNAAPHVVGSKQLLLILMEETAQKGAKDLATQMRTFLLKKSKTESFVTEKTSRRRRINFPDASPDEFYNMKRAIKDNEQWEFKSADTADLTIEVEYVGLIDNLADQLYDVLKSGGFAVGTPEYTNSRNTVTFRKK